MIVKIIYYEISTELESKLRAKLLKEDELAACYEALKEKKKNHKKSVNILCIAMAVFFVLLTVCTIISGIDNIVASLFFIFGPLILMAAAGCLGWYLYVGKVALKWNKLVKENYPDLYDNYKL